MQRLKFIIILLFYLNIQISSLNILSAQKISTDKIICQPIATQRLSEIFKNPFGTLPHEILVKKEGNGILKIPFAEGVLRKHCDLGHSAMTEFIYKKSTYYKMTNELNNNLNVQFIIKEGAEIFYIQVIKTAPVRRNDNGAERYIWYKKFKIDPCESKFLKKPNKIHQAIYYNSKNHKAKKLKNNALYKEHKIFNPLIVIDFTPNGTKSKALLPESFKLYYKKAARHSRTPERKFKKVKIDNYIGQIRYFQYNKFIKRDNKRGGL